METSAKSLTRAILETVARFDIFNFPLTSLEIWQFLNIKATYSDILKNLESTKLENSLGFYYLPNRQELINIREQRYREAGAKIELALRRLKLISWLPNIKLIALANIIGPHNLKTDNDLDLFIITKTNRLWLVKFLATIILKLTNLRPTEKKVKNKLCLSFLIDESALDLRAYKIDNSDWFFSLLITGFLPLYGDLQTYNNFIKANTWLDQDLPNWQLGPYQPLKRFKIKNGLNKTFKLFNFLEPLSRYLHELMMDKNLKNLKNKSTSVVMTDHVLKLHSNDRRPYFFQEEEIRLADYTNIL